MSSRTIQYPTSPKTTRFKNNSICNQKYTFFTFLPLVLYNQFKFFFNLYFLLVSLSQFIPALKIGFILTYFGPLCFVLFLTLAQEFYDDFKRYKRDIEANKQVYKKLLFSGSLINISSSLITVGDIILIEKDQRVPADCILLKTTETTGSCFIRTDQLDGETDWKLRIALPVTQQLQNYHDFFSFEGYMNGIHI